jgi:hypothetical protein
MIKSTLMTVIGAALMGWGGSSITAGLGFTDWRQVNVALFAVGIIFLAQVPCISLHARIRKLEAMSQSARTGAQPLTS